MLRCVCLGFEFMFGIADQVYIFPFLVIACVQPQERIPMHPVYNVQDWDDPEGAIDWPRMGRTMKEVCCINGLPPASYKHNLSMKIRRTGVIPPEHYSHDHLNEQREVPVDQPIMDRWRETFTKLQVENEKTGEKIIWVMVDGFLLYWDQVQIRDFVRA